MNYKDVSILTVNYNTPQLLNDLLESIEKYYPEILIYIVDGSDNKEMIRSVKAIARNKKNVILFSMGKNIHHGPGLDFGIRKTKTRYVLMLDTDSIIINAGLIEAMLENINGGYGVGTIEYVDNNGWNVPEGKGIQYLHPRCALIDKDQYFQYKPAVKHGAPMMSAMGDIFEKGKSHILINFDRIDEYYIHIGRGTVNLTGGYHLENKNLSIKSKIKKIVKCFFSSSQK